MADVAAWPTFVFGIPGAPVRLTGPGPFAPNPGTATEPPEPPALVGKPAVNGFMLFGEAVDVPLVGRSGFDPELDGEAPGTAMLVPVTFCGTCPAKSGFGIVLIASTSRP